jgi:hypothetical protein
VGLLIVFVACLIAWSSVLITVDGNTITRRLFLVFVSVRKIYDIADVRDAIETDIYGSHKYSQIHFNDGEKWNLAMSRARDIKEIKDSIYKRKFGDVA